MAKQHFTAIKVLSDRADAPLGGIAIGMAGARTDSDRQRIRAAAGRIWPNVPCYATNDLETALVAADTGSKTTLAARILILSGTGSCCFGRPPDHQTARVGGWGHIIGDKGSGYEIGLRSLKAAVHYLDCDGKWSLLGQSLLQALLLNEPEDLIDWAKSASKPDISALAIEVFAAAAKGDAAIAAVGLVAAERYIVQRHGAAGAVKFTAPEGDTGDVRRLETRVGVIRIDGVVIDRRSGVERQQQRHWQAEFYQHSTAPFSQTAG